MTILAQKLIRALIVIVALFLVVVAAAFVVNLTLPVDDRVSLVIGLKVAGLVALVGLPPGLWLVFRKPKTGTLSAFALEEMSLNEEELRGAVSLWVFANRDRRVEGDLRFLEDSDGSVSCRLTVRAED